MDRFHDQRIIVFEISAKNRLVMSNTVPEFSDCIKTAMNRFPAEFPGQAFVRSDSTTGKTRTETI